MYLDDYRPSRSPTHTLHYSAYYLAGMIRYANMQQHLAAASPSLPILRHLLLHGGSVHIRNRTGRTPLFLAANAGLSEHVLLLRKSGAHLHSEEWTAARLLARRSPGIWGLAGIGPREISEDEGAPASAFAAGGMAGSAP